MATWAKTTDLVLDRGFGGSRGGATIEGAVIHHVGGPNGRDYVANTNARNSHPTYHINRPGNVAGIVHPNRRPYSTAHSVDRVAITIEVDNDKFGGSEKDPSNWTITPASMEAVLEVCLDHMRQERYTRAAYNTPGKDQPGVFFIAEHRQYKQTSCPGPYIHSKIQWIIDELNRRIKDAATTKPAKPAPAPKPARQNATSYVRAPGEAGAPAWPRGPLMARIQRALKARGRYDGDADGVGGEFTAKGIQRTLNHSQLNGVKPYVRTVEDGLLGVNNAYGVQHYARKYGDYTGPRDGDPRDASWTGFALGLERP